MRTGKTSSSKVASKTSALFFPISYKGSSDAVNLG
jgi:hypothetical protein